MAVVILRHPRARSAARVTSVPLAVAGSALVPPMLDLLAQLQREPLLAAAAFGASVVAAGLLLATLALAVRTAWLGAAVLALLASITMRLGGVELAPLLGVAAVFALGIGGAFKAHADAADLLGGPVLVEKAETATPLVRAA